MCSCVLCAWAPRRCRAATLAVPDEVLFVEAIPYGATGKVRWHLCHRHLLLFPKPSALRFPSAALPSQRMFALLEDMPLTRAQSPPHAHTHNPHADFQGGAAPGGRRAAQRAAAAAQQAVSLLQAMSCLVPSAGADTRKRRRRPCWAGLCGARPRGACCIYNAVFTLTCCLP